MYMKLKENLKLVWLIAGLFVCFIGNAQSKGVLKGLITDQKNGDALIGVTVRDTMPNSSYGTATDIDGNYELVLPAGTYAIATEFMGYTRKVLNVTINAGATVVENIELSEEDLLMSTVVVTTSKYAKPLGEQVSSVEVIKPTMIANAQNTDISQTIEKVPGVDVIDGQANIRGGSGYSYGAGSRVLLLMDDLPILTADSGFPNWDFLPIENIGQVEVVKGAASSLYGSSAMNGIINIRTAYPTEKPHFEFSVFNSTYSNPRNNKINDTLNKSWWDKENKPYETGMSIAYRKKYGKLDVVTGAYFYNQKSWRQSDYEERGRVNLNLRYRIPKFVGMSVGLNTNVMLNRGASFLIWDYNPDSTSTSYNPAGAYQLWNSTQQINNDGFKLSIDPFFHFTFAKLGIRNKILGRYYKNNNQNDTKQSTNSDFIYGEYQAQKEFEDIGFTVIGGVVGSLSIANAELYTGDGKFRATNVAGYLQLDKRFFDRLNITLGGRYEWNEIEGDKEAKPVMRAGFNYKLAPYTYLRGSYGQAYRFPTIAEKFVRTSIGTVDLAGLPVEIGIYPNANLKSETGWSGEIGIKQGFQIGGWRGFIDGAGFINRYQDMMEFTFGVPTSLLGLMQLATGWDLDSTVIEFPAELANTLAAGFQSINIGNTQILGADFSIAGTSKFLGCQTNALIGYTYTRPTFQVFDSIQYDLSSNKSNVLKYRFRHTFKMDLETNIKKFVPGISIRYYSFMEAIDEAFNYFLPGIREFREQHNGGTTILDLRLIYRITKSHNVSLVVKNVANLEYALRPALIDAPRSFTLKYTYKIGDE